MTQQMSKSHGFDSRRRSKRPLSSHLRFLILCEGTKTEVNYLKAVLDTQKNLRSGSSLLDVENCNIQGAGRGTIALVDHAKKLACSRQLPYDRVWLVFDKDNFPDFNQAIREAGDAGYYVAWSNEAFELWFLLHFRNQTTPIGRKDLIKALEKELRKYYEDFSYDKSDLNMFQLLEKYGDRDKASKFADKQRESPDYAPNTYHKCNPCTCVDLLIADLTDEDRQKEILEKLRDK